MTSNNNISWKRWRVSIKHPLKLLCLLKLILQNVPILRSSSSASRLLCHGTSLHTAEKPDSGPSGLSTVAGQKSRTHTLRISAVVPTFKSRRQRSRNALCVSWASQPDILAIPVFSLWCQNMCKPVFPWDISGSILFRAAWTGRGYKTEHWCVLC